jgi:hypothetical protein
MNKLKSRALRWSLIVGIKYNSKMHRPYNLRILITVDNIRRPMKPPFSRELSWRYDAKSLGNR